MLFAYNANGHNLNEMIGFAANWYAMIDVHITAPFRLLREAFLYFIRDAAKQEQATNGQANPRKVVNISSVSALYGIPGQINYSAAKAGIIGITKTLSLSIDPLHIIRPRAPLCSSPGSGAPPRVFVGNKDTRNNELNRRTDHSGTYSACSSASFFLLGLLFPPRSHPGN